MKRNQKTTFFLGIVVIAGLMFVAYGITRTNLDKNYTSVAIYGIETTSFVEFGDKRIRVEVAQTNEERIRGLSGRGNLPAFEGMIFVFEKNDYHGIWMKDMKFPIDIVWFDDNKCVVSVVESAEPNSYPMVFQPKVESRYVLEINAGFAKTIGVKEGVCAKFSLQKNNK